MKIPQLLFISGMEYGCAKQQDSVNVQLMTCQFSSHVCVGSYFLRPKYPILLHLVSLFSVLVFKEPVLDS